MHRVVRCPLMCCVACAAEQPEKQAKSGQAAIPGRDSTTKYRLSPEHVGNLSVTCTLTHHLKAKLWWHC